jgi:uncharacterized membrane protein YhaH (DUF805 family)
LRRAWVGLVPVAQFASVGSYLALLISVGVGWGDSDRFDVVFIGAAPIILVGLVVAGWAAHRTRRHDTEVESVPALVAMALTVGAACAAVLVAAMLGYLDYSLGTSDFSD